MGRISQTLIAGALQISIPNKLLMPAAAVVAAVVGPISPTTTRLPWERLRPVMEPKLAVMTMCIPQPAWL